MYNEATDELIIVDEQVKDEYEKDGWIAIDLIG